MITITFDFDTYKKETQLKVILILNDSAIS